MRDVGTSVDRKPPLQRPDAWATGALVTIDHRVSHRSIEPSYAQHALSPNVILNVREVVLHGRERTAGAEGKVVLMLHGGTTPGTVAFDLDHGNCSTMRWLARAGWDTFALDLEGYGQSTRPPMMDAQAAFPSAKAPVSTEVALADLARAVEFILALRGVEKVCLLGWSNAASRECPLFAIAHPERVAKLVLLGAAYNSLGYLEESRSQAELIEREIRTAALKPSQGTWLQFGSRPEILTPGVSEVVREALLASDPRSGALGGRYRVPLGRLVDLLRTSVQFDARQVTVPTLVVRGELDTFAVREDNLQLVEELGSTTKHYVEIPDASHMAPYETRNVALYGAMLEFLDARPGRGS